MAVAPLPDRSAALPTPLTPLVGREQEIAAVAGMVRRLDVRLVTLTGPGGVGKTRLAIRIAEELAGGFAAGAAFVDLAPIRDPALVLTTVAGVLRVREGGDRALAEQLAAFLQDRDLLLVLDNFEQVLSAAPQVTSLLAACPRLKVLVTSRAVLRVSGEHNVPVPPLSLPDPNRQLDLALLGETEAVALFVQRARAADPSFVLTAANAASVAEVVRRLDSLPLAIELAAARARVLSPAALLARLTDRLRLLTGGARDAQPRHQTMREAIAWSYDLLTEEEQVLFRRLSVFLGGFTLEAADAIVDGSGHRGSAVFEGIVTLADASLLRREAETDGQARFGMLETIREYGLDRLQAGDEADGVRRAHADYYTALAERAEPELRGADQAGWLTLLEADHHNLLSALTWSLEDEPGIALRLAVALTRFWYYRSYGSEGRDWLERVAIRAADASSNLRADAFFGAAKQATQLRDFPAAIRSGEASLRIARELGDATRIGRALETLANAVGHDGDYERATALFDQALVMFQEVDDRYWIAVTETNRGFLALRHGDLDRAATVLTEALSLVHELNHPWAAAFCVTSLGMVRHDQGDLVRAAALYREALALWRGVDDLGSMAWCFEHLAGTAEAMGRPDQAARLFAAAEVLLTARGLSPAWTEPSHHGRMLEAARARLDDPTLAGAWAEGRKVSLEQAIAEALAVEASLPAASILVEPAASFGITPRELEVLRLVAAGKSDREIGEALFVSPRTVGAHVSHVLAKLGVENRAAAAALASREGLV